VEALSFRRRLLFFFLDLRALGPIVDNRLRRGRLRSLLLLAFLPLPLFAQPTQDRVREYRRSNEHQILKEFLTLLSIPNVASDTQNIRKNAALIVEMMKQRGLNPRLLEGSTPDTPPAVYGEWKTPGAQRTILVYADAAHAKHAIIGR